MTGLISAAERTSWLLVSPLVAILAFFLLLPMFAGSVAAMVPGAFMVSRLGRERATVAITLLSISLALPTLIWGH